MTFKLLILTFIVKKESETRPKICNNIFKIHPCKGNNKTMHYQLNLKADDLNQVIQLTKEKREYSRNASTLMCCSLQIFSRVTK